MRPITQREWDIDDIREHYTSVRALEAKGWTRCEARFERARWLEPLDLAAARTRREAAEQDLADARRRLAARSYVPDMAIDQDGMLTVYREPHETDADALRRIIAANPVAARMIDDAITIRRSLRERTAQLI